MFRSSWQSIDIAGVFLKASGCRRNVGEERMDGLGERNGDLGEEGARAGL